MIVVLMGVPGAGKGTQAEYLKIKKGFLKVSTGDLLRKEIDRKTSLGKHVEEVISRGKLVSDDVLLQIMKNELSASKDKNLVLDGFPRTVPQAEWLAQNAKIEGVIHIEANPDELLSRIRGRLTCPKCESVYHLTRKPPIREGYCDKCGSLLKVRNDDTDESVFLHRLEAYRYQTEPVLEFYKQRKQYFHIDGDADEETVSKQIDILLSKFGN